MKTKIFAVVLALSACVMMVFAAKVDPCTEKYESCSNACTNVQVHCKTSGSIPENCEKAFAICMQKCDKAKADCQGNAKPTPKPKTTK